MNNLKYRKAAAAGMLIAVLITIAASLPLPVFAGENVPVTIDIRVTYIVNGNAGTAGGDRFSLTADEPGTPMPDGKTGGTKTITIRDEGSYSFGDILYERPDVYWYTITRETTDKKGVVKDEPVYKAKVIALNDGHGYVLVYEEGSDEKTELIYTDRVAPETGDRSMTAMYFIMSLAAASAFAALLAAGKGKRKKRGAE
jgi:hypothetical protein